MKNAFVGVVDDDAALCSSLVDLMCATGYGAESFSSVETLLRSDNLRSLDCIIADVHMPGLGGIDLIKEFRKRDITIPVILITALPDRHLDEEADLRGALCLLGKPLQTSSLLSWIERSLVR